MKKLDEEISKADRARLQTPVILRLKAHSCSKGHHASRIKGNLSERPHPGPTADFLS